MRGRLGEATMVPDDFRSTDAVRFPASLDGLRKHFLDIARVLDTTDIDFRCHGIRGAEMDATYTAKTLVFPSVPVNIPNMKERYFFMICSHHYISDFAALHFLHSICRLLSVVCPPLLQGMMWSPSISSKAYSVLIPFATHKGHL